MRGITTNVIRLMVALAVSLVVAAIPAVAQARATSYTVWTVAGTSAECASPPWCGDNLPAAGAKLSFPQAVAVGSAGNVYIADWGDNEVREVTPAGKIILFGGSGTICQKPPDCGDGGRATSARLSFPGGVAVDSAGNVYVADTGDNEVRKISRSGTITRIGGTGKSCAKPPACGDGGPATSATLTRPTGLALDQAGNLYVADTGDQEIRKISRSGRITLVAGTGKRCRKAPACGDSGPATKARLNFPEAVAIGGSGLVYIADSGDQEIRRISTAGTITTVAGTGTACSTAPSCGDGGAPTKAELNYPNGVAVGPSGNLFIADSSDNEVREVTGGKIIRLAGTGKPCAEPPACGDDLAASAASLNYPSAVFVDRHGGVYVADTGDNEIRWLSGVRAGRFSTSTGWVALGAFSDTVAKNSVVVRFVLGRAANVELTVRHSGHSETVASGRAHAGFNQLTWNRKFRGKAAAKGRYKLVVGAAIGHLSTSSTLRVRL
jgi:sugar lactone lactonase YvrE